MLFNTLSYFVFLTFIVLIFYSIKPRYRWILLLSGSYFFYACWKPAFLLLIILSTLVVYISALQLEKNFSPSIRRFWLIFPISLVLTILLFFKYAGFFQIVLLDLGLIHQHYLSDILLPVGISFYTFQAIGYLIDVFRKKNAAERHLGYFALYISFFPQLVAGPIERASNLLPQLKNPAIMILPQNISAGVKYLILGMFKKVVVADNLALFVNEVFQNLTDYHGFHYLLAVLLFSFQIYCDFSAYSDMAVGSARFLGIKLIQNFKYPFTAVSISDFWGRWHISLSTWFRDYVFLPLAWLLSKKVTLRNHFYLSNLVVYSVAVLITFFLAGLWHGANYTFVVWGVLHALLLILESGTSKIRKIGFKKIGISRKSKIYILFAQLFTFLLISFAFIFFRSANLFQASLIIKGIFSRWGSITMPELSLPQYFVGGLTGLLLLLMVEFKMKNVLPESYFSGNPVLFRWGFFYLLLFFMFSAGYFGNIEFIYFQF